MSGLRRGFARRLKALRIERSLTQQELAQRSSLSTSFVSNMERGLNGPSFQSLQRIADALDVPVRELFDF